MAECVILQLVLLIFVVDLKALLNEAQALTLSQLIRQNILVTKNVKIFPSRHCSACVMTFNLNQRNVLQYKFRNYCNSPITLRHSAD